MAAGVTQENRILWAHRAQGFVCRQSFDARLWTGLPFVLMPSPAHDPFTWLGFGNGCLDHRHDVVPIACVAKVELHERSAVAHVMPVAFDEPGNGEQAFDVENAGVVTDVGLDIDVGAYGEDQTIFGRERLRLKHIIIDGDDLTVEQHQVGRFRTGGATATGGRPASV